MRLKCVDGNERKFEFIREKLIRLGFDPNLLDRDENLVSTSLPPGTGFTKALELARNGINLPSHIFHYSRRSKKINPISTEFDTLLKSNEYLAFLPSIETEKETSLAGKMDPFTFIARLVTKIFRFGRDNQQKSIFQTQIFGENLDQFKFNHGYKITAHQWVEQAQDYFVLIKDENDQVLVIHPSLLCNTNKVMINTLG